MKCEACEVSPCDHKLEVCEDCGDVVCSKCGMKWAKELSDGCCSWTNGFDVHSHYSNY